MFKFTRYHIELAYANGVRDFSELKLTEVNLTGVNLTGVNLKGANLSWTNLTGADLTGAELSWANLSWTNLNWANLSWANLSWAILIGAELIGASLTGASLIGANLSLAKGIRYAQCSFSGHGERGRQLLLVEIDNQLIFFCGCFSGSRLDLAHYIERGDSRYKESRNAAKDFLLSVI